MSGKKFFAVGLKASDHGPDNTGIRKQVTGGNAVLSFGNGIGAERLSAGKMRRPALAVDGSKLPVLAMGAAVGLPLDGSLWREAISQQVEDLVSKPGVCNVLRHYSANAGPHPGATAANGDARRGNGDAELVAKRAASDN